MNLDEIFAEIESQYFATNINILSGTRILLLALEDDEALRNLIQFLNAAPETKTRVFQRLVDLLPLNPQPEYRHPYDSALTGYLYALSRVDPELAQQVINRILETPKLWWALRLAKHLREEMAASSVHPAEG